MKRISNYAGLRRYPDFTRRLPYTTLASLGTAMLPLAVVTWAVGHKGSYSDAGSVAASLSLGYAVLLPWRGRLVDRLGPRNALTRLGVATGAAATAFLMLGEVDAPTVLLWPFAFLFGATQPPLSAALRATVAHTVDVDARAAAYTAQTALSDLLQ